MHYVSLALYRVYGCSNERRKNKDGGLGVRFQEEARKLPSVMSKDDLAFCGRSFC